MNNPATPSDLEYRGYYNITRADAGDALIKTTSSVVKKLTLSEVKQVGDAVYKIVCRDCNRYTFQDKEILEYYRSCVCESLTDRTLNISFLNHNDCTISSLVNLRKLLASEFPLWRIRLAGTTLETTILIYPTALRLGSLYCKTPTETEFEDIVEKEMIARGPKYLANIEKQHTVASLLREMAPGFGPIEIVVAIYFDNYCGNRNECTIWILRKSQISSIDLQDCDQAMTGDQFRVKADGDVGYHVTDDAPFAVQEWIFPQNMLPMKLKILTYHPDGKAGEIDLDVEPLKRVYSANS